MHQLPQRKQPGTMLISPAVHKQAGTGDSGKGLCMRCKLHIKTTCLV